MNLILYLPIVKATHYTKYGYMPVRVHSHELGSYKFTLCSIRFGITYTHYITIWVTCNKHCFLPFMLPIFICPSTVPPSFASYTRCVVYTTTKPIYRHFTIKQSIRNSPVSLKAFMFHQNFANVFYKWIITFDCCIVCVVLYKCFAMIFCILYVN